MRKKEEKKKKRKCETKAAFRTTTAHHQPPPALSGALPAFFVSLHGPRLSPFHITGFLLVKHLFQTTSVMARNNAKTRKRKLYIKKKSSSTFSGVFFCARTCKNGSGRGTKQTSTTRARRYARVSRKAYHDKRQRSKSINVTNKLRANAPGNNHKIVRIYGKAPPFCLLFLLRTDCGAPDCDTDKKTKASQSELRKYPSRGETPFLFAMEHSGPYDSSQPIRYR